MATTLDVKALLASRAAGQTQRPSTAVAKDDDLQYDLGLLSAYDPAPVDGAALKADGDAALLRWARENMQLLSNRLYGLLADEQNKTLIRLPAPTTALPREKPLPAPKPLTRWEKFAKEKGIVKRKRSKMVWDEAEQKWLPRYGYGRANNPKDTARDWLVVAKPGDDGSVDPFEEKADDRRKAHAKQKKQEARNRLEAAQAAGVLHAGYQGAGRSKASKEDTAKCISHALSAAQTSTASVGRHDRVVRNEPAQGKGKRKSYASATDAAHADADRERAARVAQRLYPEDGAKHASAIDGRVAAKHAKLAEEKSNREAKAKKDTPNRKWRAAPPGAKTSASGGGKKGKKGGGKK